MMSAMQAFDEYFVPVYSPAPFVLERGVGSRVWDTDGRDYVDFAAGIAVSALGHAHPAMVSALTKQAEKLWHLSNLFMNEPALALAKTLCERTFAEQVFFANSGAEANEAALKLARKVGRNIHQDKTQIISFSQSFHGRTLFTVSVGGQEKYSSAFAPLPADIVHATYNDLESVKALISKRTCAVMVEPIQGEGGVVPADEAFLVGLRALCDDHQALLIFDEVQTGVGRTGSLYAYMDTPVVPDVLTSAKGLGGGFPIGAMLTTRAIGGQLGVGEHGTTYGGNPLGCAVAGAVLDVIDESVLMGVRERSAYICKKIAELNARHQVFAGVRGRGLLLGLVLSERYQGLAKTIVSLAGEEGLLVLVAGSDVVRVVPSLLITKDDIDEGMARLDRALSRLVG